MFPSPKPYYSKNRAPANSALNWKFCSKALFQKGFLRKFIEKKGDQKKKKNAEASATDS